MSTARRVGILALQGDFEAHAKLVSSLGAEPREVRVPTDLDGLDALIIPGGESTVMTLGIERERLAEPLRAMIRRGTPVLGTCAGMIMLDRDHLAVLDIKAQRNAFGRQLRSFETDIELAELTIDCIPGSVSCVGPGIGGGRSLARMRGSFVAFGSTTAGAMSGGARQIAEASRSGIAWRSIAITSSNVCTRRWSSVSMHARTTRRSESGTCGAHASIALGFVVAIFTMSALKFFAS